GRAPRGAPCRATGGLRDAPRGRVAGAARGGRRPGREGARHARGLAGGVDTHRRPSDDRLTSARALPPGPRLRLPPVAAPACGSAVPPPLLGQHTNDVLAELGYDQDEIDALERNGVVAGHRG